MENIGEWEQMNLKNELLRGMELAKQLQIHLNMPARASVPSSSFSDEGGESIVQKILSSYEKALSMLNYGGSGVTPVKVSASPSSLAGSPRSEDSDREFKDSDQRKSSRKRTNICPTWTQKVRVFPGTALEGALDDGFCWRKYGQKPILGAKHPRGYYRCTHRKLQGCLATKQVQRSDDDSAVFQITYQRHHTCSRLTDLFPTPEFPPPNTTPSPEALLNSLSSLTVITSEPPFSPVNYSEFSSGLRAEFSGNIDQIFPESTQLSGIFPPETSTSRSPTFDVEFQFGEVEMDPSFTFDDTNLFF